jgi:hypothetical protein
MYKMREDLKLKASKDEQKRQERIHNVAMSVNTDLTIFDYLSSMAVASKKNISSSI